MMAQSRLLALALASLLLAVACARAADHLEGFDFDEPTPAPSAGSGQGVIDLGFGGPSAGQQAAHSAPAASAAAAGQQAAAAQQQQGEPAASGSSGAAGGAGDAAAKPRVERKRLKRDNLYLEYTMAAAFLIYIVASVIGQRTNSQLAKQWALHFASAGGVLDKNFSLVGGEDGEVLTKESNSVYKIYASGRRHCEGMLATLNLKARQEVLSLLWYLISPTEDTLDVEVYMNEASMPPIVLGVGTPKAARWMQQNRSDVKTFTRRINIAGDQAPGWPNAKLHVLAEHSSIFHDIFSQPQVLQVFTSPQHALALKHFRMIHVTSENTESSHRRVLRFQFALPTAPNMGAIAALVALVPVMIDAVGAYRLPPEIKKKVTEARQKAEAAANEDARKTRAEAIQQRKLEKLQEEKERMARMNPEARRKLEEKQAKQAAKKQFRTKVVRM